LRRDRAITKWLDTESRNAETNDRVFNTPSEFQILRDVPWSKFTEKLQSVVASIIGEVMPESALIGSFSGGASTSRKRTASHPAGKYLGIADITASAQAVWDLVSPEMPGWLRFDDRSNRVVKGNVLFTVPKKTDIDRCACKEPDLNMFMQKGVGSSIRRALRRVGVNLNDQSRNQSLAHQGSIGGHLATLDLSSASDSVSTELVRLALPVNWFWYLDAIRCHVTVIDDVEHVNEMFSSMGNGFTFELESLLFYAITRTVAYFEGIPGVVSVYGDDIICPTPLVDSLIWVLGYLGFQVNDDKSFSTGPFRESCGGHYLNGVNITPFYLRAPVTSTVDLIRFANQLRLWADEDDLPVLMGEPEVYNLWKEIRDLIPKSLWGGRDLNSTFSVVTPHSPRGQLVPVVKRRSTKEGGFIHWLNTTWNRDSVTTEVETSIMSITTDRFRTRPNRVVNSNIKLFVEELDDREY
jgi:hypothetical protein